MIAIELDELLKRVESLPRLPDSAMRLMRVVNDPSKSIPQIVDAIRFDQTITAELLKLANSAYFGRRHQVTSIDQAVTVLGTGKLLQLVMAAQAKSLLGPEQHGYGLSPNALWKHSVAVALGAQKLAERVKFPERGLPFTAGLLHDIGKIVLNEFVATEFAVIAGMVKREHTTFLEAELRVLGCTHAEVGGLVARRWNLPEAIVHCIRFHHDPSQRCEPDTLVDLVHVADAACLLVGVGGGDDGHMYKGDPLALTRLGLTAQDFHRLGAEIVAESKRVQKALAEESAPEPVGLTALVSP